MPDASAFASYLDDHLAGATAARALVDTLRASPLAAQAPWLDDLDADLDAAHKALMALRRALPSGPGTVVKRATAWLGEKGVEAKFALDAARERPAYAWFEGLETLVVGLSGQAALWRLFQRLPGAPLPPDQAALWEGLAQTWAAQVDEARLAAAAEAFAA